MTTTFTYAKVGNVYTGADGKLYSTNDIQIIDLDTGKPIADPAGREYPVIEANAVEGWFLAYTYDVLGRLAHDGEVMAVTRITDRKFEIRSMADANPYDPAA